MTPQIPEGYTVEYSYGYTHQTRAGRSLKGEKHRTTWAMILNKFGDVVADDYAICGPRDQFNKRIGRNIALGRALKELNANH